MTCITDAQDFLVKARNRLGNAVLNPRNDYEAGVIGTTMDHVVKAIAALEQISQQGTSPQQTGGGANLPPAGADQ